MVFWWAIKQVAHLYIKHLYEEVAMSTYIENHETQTLHMTVQGRRVTLKFDSEPNLELADLVKQTLLSSYFSETED